MTPRDIRNRLPTLAHSLGEALLADGFGLLDALGSTTLDNTEVTMAITFRSKDGGPGVRVALSIGPEADPEAESDDDPAAERG